MQITIIARHVEVPEDVKAYAREKAEKLLRFYDRIQAIEVIFDHEADQSSVEMIVSAGARNSFVGHETGPDALALIDLTTDKLERQLTKHKERLRNRMHLNKKPPLTEESSAEDE